MSPRAAPAAPQRACRALPSQLCHASSEAPPMALTCNGGGRGAADGSLLGRQARMGLPAELPRVSAAAIQMLHDARRRLVCYQEATSSECVYRVIKCMRASLPRVARVFRMLGIPSLCRFYPGAPSVLCRFYRVAMLLDQQQSLPRRCEHIRMAITAPRQGVFTRVHHRDE